MSLPGSKILFKSRYSQLVDKKPDGKWRGQLEKCVQETCAPFALVAIEYAAILEEEGNRLVKPNKTFVANNPNLTFKHILVRRLSEALVGSADQSIKGVIHEYGNMSPVGVILDQLRKIGLFPVRNHLNRGFLLYVVYVVFHVSVSPQALTDGVA